MTRTTPAALTNDVFRLQQLIRTTLRALAVATVRAQESTSTRTLLERARALNESLAGSQSTDAEFAAYIRDYTQQTRNELEALARRAEFRATNHPTSPAAAMQTAVV